MAETNCLAGCISNYLCGTPDLPGPGGKQAESFAPWCWITIGVGTKKITVGNESYEKDRNTACIKSMEIGWTDTPSFKCEIVDERGGTVGAVADAIRKCLKGGIGKGTMCEFQFGWILTTCSGGPKKSHVMPSKKFKLMIQKLDVSYSEGKIKYTIEAVALPYDKSREDKIKGSDPKPVKIEQAIDSLCSQDPACTVRYVELTPDGKLKDVKFNWAPSGEVRASFQSDNMNRISTITKWLAPFRIKDGKCDKGVIIYFSPDKPDELIIMKDPMTGPNESRQCRANATNAEYGPLGTFIVNGGKCSTVIEFTPSMDIVSAIGASMASGGGTSGPNKSGSQFVEDKRCGNQKSQGAEAGTQLQTTITQQAFDNYGPKNANDEALKSELAHHRASVVVSINNPGVSAQLKILGNPDDRFCNFGANRNLAIVVINPYHIRSSGECGDWLAYPVCNELFSNRLWMCKSINHSITTGSYTTTIEAHLVSIVQIAGGDPLGGQGGGGPVLENTCG